MRELIFLLAVILLGYSVFGLDGSQRIAGLCASFFLASFSFSRWKNVFFHGLGPNSTKYHQAALGSTITTTAFGLCAALLTRSWLWGPLLFLAVIIAKAILFIFINTMIFGMAVEQTMKRMNMETLDEPPIWDEESQRKP